MQIELQTAIIGGVVLIVGVLLGQGLTTTREHQRWLLDQKKAEYRELVDLLYDTITEITWEPLGSDPQADIERALSDREAIKKLVRIFEDRIFIAKQLKESDAHGLWLEMKKTIYSSQKPRDLLPELRPTNEELRKKEEQLRATLVELANQDMVAFKLYR